MDREVIVIPKVVLLHHQNTSSMAINCFAATLELMY